MMPTKINLINQVFGRLTVIAPDVNKGRRTQWKCLCECGEEVTVLTDSLRSGRTQSCGCLRKEVTAEKNKQNTLNLIGQRFGRLTVIKQSESYRNHSAWLCECDCGNTKIVNSVELTKGETLSCGCLRSSFGEMSIETILKQNNIPYIKEYSFSDLVSENNIPLRFDFAILDTEGNLIKLIEYDGEQHFMSKTDGIWTDTLQKRKIRDNMKNQYCKVNSIPLVRIPYWEKNNISLTLLNDIKYLI